MRITRAIFLGPLITATVTAVLLSSSACDLARSKKAKLPKAPTPPQAQTQAVNPGAWASQGDSVCPAINQPSTLGAPGTSVRPGRLTRDHASGRLACQVDGLDHGPATDIDPAGFAVGQYFHGQRNGRWEGRHANHQLAWQGSFVEGKRVGQWTSWNEVGGLESTGELRGESRHGMWLFWEDGNDSPSSRNSYNDADRFAVYKDGRKTEFNGSIIGGKPVLSHPVCSVGFAAPRCRTILAAGLTLRLGPAERSDGGDELSMSVDGDFIVNVAESHGVGVGGSIYAGDEYARFGARMTYRYWLHYMVAAEVGGGLLFVREDRDGTPADVGQSGRVAISLADQVAIGLEVERYDINGDGDIKLAAHATLRVGIVPLGLAAYILGSLGK